MAEAENSSRKPRPKTNPCIGVTDRRNSPLSTHKLVARLRSQGRPINQLVTRPAYRGDMGFFTWLTGTSRPEPGTNPRSPDEVRAALLAVNRPSAPFLVRAGEANEPELVSEWRIVDARWYEVFAAAELQKAAKILMRLDVARREV